MCALNTTANSWSVGGGTRGTEANRTPGAPTPRQSITGNVPQEAVLPRPEFNFASTRASTKTDISSNSSS